jgi:ABC-type bacteriocin/lantibiotic exporter with double-glycine peptidase domain
MSQAQPAIAAARPQFTRWDMARLLLGRPFYFMLVLLVIEAALAASTTYLIIKAGRDVSNDEFLIADLLWILAAQSASYAVGAISWIYAERAGFGAYGRYMNRFARDNRHRSKLLNEKSCREQVEPFLTGETFHIFFEMVYELEQDLKMFLNLVFNVIIFATQIDSSLAIAYSSVFGTMLFLQWIMRKRVAYAYLENQRQNNRVTAQGYTAWDNIFTGNRYNLRLWMRGFKSRMRDAVRAQIIAILTREGLSAASGIIGLSIVFGTMVYIANRYEDDTGLLIALAATLPRQIELTHDVHALAAGWNEMLQIWVRMEGAARNMHPAEDPQFDDRIKFDRIILREGDRSTACQSVDEAMRIVLSRPTGRVLVRGGNGSGKSTLLAALKDKIKNMAYYFPTTDRLAFGFTAVAASSVEPEAEEESEVVRARSRRSRGFSSGERQLRSLQEIVQYTDAKIYLLDEWDANLDASNRAVAEALVEQLASRARVVEVSHRDRPLVPRTDDLVTAA